MFFIELLGRHVPAKSTDEGVRAVTKSGTVKYTSVERYLESKFGEALNDARTAMRQLAKAYDPGQLAEQAYELYQAFRPNIPAGKKGWCAKGDLDLDYIRKLARG